MALINAIMPPMQTTTASERANIIPPTQQSSPPPISDPNNASITAHTSPTPQTRQSQHNASNERLAQFQTITQCDTHENDNNMDKCNESTQNTHGNKITETLQPTTNHIAIETARLSITTNNKPPRSTNESGHSANTATANENSNAMKMHQQMQDIECMDTMEMDNNADKNQRDTAEQTTMNNNRHGIIGMKGPTNNDAVTQTDSNINPAKNGNTGATNITPTTHQTYGVHQMEINEPPPAYTTHYASEIIHNNLTASQPLNTVQQLTQPTPQHQMEIDNHTDSNQSDASDHSMPTQQPQPMNLCDPQQQTTHTTHPPEQPDDQISISTQDTTTTTTDDHSETHRWGSSHSNI